MGWLWVMCFHRSVLEMELSFGFYGEGRKDGRRLFPEAGKNTLQENLITGLLLGVFQLVGLSRRCCDDRNIILEADWNLALNGAFYSLDWAKHLAMQSVTQRPCWDKELYFHQLPSHISLWGFRTVQRKFRVQVAMGQFKQLRLKSLNPWYENRRSGDNDYHRRSGTFGNCPKQQQKSIRALHYWWRTVYGWGKYLFENANIPRTWDFQK